MEFKLRPVAAGFTLARNPLNSPRSTAPFCALALLCGLTSPLAWASEPLGTEVEVRDRRGVQSFLAEAELEASPPGRLVARLRSGERTGPQIDAVCEGARLKVQLLMNQRLLPGRYRLEVLPPGGEPLYHWEFQLGTDQEAQAAVERHLSWLRAASSALRALTGGLERWGGFLHARQAAAREAAEEAQAERYRLLFQAYLDEWDTGLLTAHLDLATYRQRLLLPPLPEASELLQTLAEGLQRRRELWQQAFRSGPAPAPAAELLDSAGRLLEVLQLDPTGIRYWKAGPLARPPLGTPEEIAAQRRFQSPLGFSVEIPPGFIPRQTDRPDHRLLLESADTQVVIEVFEFPDATTPELLAENLLVSRWEGLRSFKLLRHDPLPNGAGLRLVYTANTGDLAERERVVEAVQVALFVPEERRIVSLRYAYRLGATTLGPMLEALEESFKLEAQ